MIVVLDTVILEILMETAIIIGSAACAELMKNYDLSAYIKIAINRSWQIRNDFDYHVGLKLYQTDHSPPKDYNIKMITRDIYAQYLRKAGGNYLCSPSVSLIAGYWAIGTIDLKRVIYFGCDLVYKNEPGKFTHFYGDSDEGPLFNQHPCMKRQDLKSVRLFIWGLLHRVLITNSSALEGSLLCFPKLPIKLPIKELHKEVFQSGLFRKLIQQGVKVFAYEEKNRCEEFDGSWGAFAKSSRAISSINKSLERWEIVQELCLELNELLQRKWGKPELII